MWNDGSLPFAVGGSDLDLHDLATDDEQNSTRKRTVDASVSYSLFCVSSRALSGCARPPLLQPR